MRVVYATPMINKMMDAISESLRINRPIAYIEITPREYDLLRFEMTDSYMFSDSLMPGKCMSFNGVQIKVAR